MQMLTKVSGRNSAQRLHVLLGKPEMLVLSFVLTTQFESKSPRVKGIAFRTSRPSSHEVLQDSQR
jgi:retron-type reverse transcriptase